MLQPLEEDSGRLKDQIKENSRKSEGNSSSLKKQAARANRQTTLENAITLTLAVHVEATDIFQTPETRVLQSASETFGINSAGTPVPLS